MGTWHPDWDWSGLTGVASAFPFATADIDGWAYVFARTQS
jgi:hypothetical protein